MHCASGCTFRAFAKKKKVIYCPYRLSDNARFTSKPNFCQQGVNIHLSLIASYLIYLFKKIKWICPSPPSCFITYLLYILILKHPKYY